MQRLIIVLAGGAALSAVAAGAQERGESRKVVQLQPYIEANQVFAAELSSGSDTVTYTQVAAGVDASVQGRNNGGSASVRYERTFGYDNSVADSSTLSGLARGYASVLPGAVTVEAGALASRTRVDGNGTATTGQVRGGPNESRIYSAYAGPTVHTQAGDAEVNANYRVGYTRVEAPDAIVVSPGAAPVDVFDESVVQSAGAHVALRPGAPLPVGVGVGGGLYQEDISNLDQRVRDVHVRGDVTVPLGASLAAVGGVGYEDVEVSARDAVRNAAGVPILGADGRLVTDKSAPRQLAYDVSGLIWDVGVVWRPSSRTAAEAHVGRRYDSTTYYGSFAWAPDSRSSVNLSVYDGIQGFGGTLTNALAALPTDFTAIRNPVTGQIDGCVASTQGGNCLTGAFGSIRSAVFRSRGVSASYSSQSGRIGSGIGVGYDRRTFIAAPGTALAAANGVVDESYWLSAYVSGQFTGRDSFALNGRAQRFLSGFANTGDATVLGASAAYRRYLIEGLSANAALSLDSFDSDVGGQDLTTAAALLGLRYDFLTGATPMFDDFYGLSGRPFQLTPDPNFWFESGTHRKALSYLGYGLAQGEGFIVVTGEVGAGKSTLVAHLMRKIDPAQLTVAQIVTSNLDGDELVHVAAQAFGIEVEPGDKAAALGAIEGFLQDEARAGRRCLLVVDESQNLSVEALEELRMLSNFQLGAHPLLQTLLLGQPEFKQVLAEHASLEQLRQRVIAAHHLDAMEASEVEPYVIHRLQCVGWQGNPQFDQRVFAELHEATGGIPRRINQVMSRLLLLGAVEQRTRIDSAMLASVRKEMEGDAAFPMAAPQLVQKAEAAPAPGPIKHAFAPAAARAANVETLLAERDVQIAELQQAVVEIAQTPPEESGAEDWAARIEALEMRLSEQDAAVRQVLSLLIDWFEAEAPRAAA